MSAMACFPIRDAYVCGATVLLSLRVMAYLSVQHKKIGVHVHSLLIGCCVKNVFQKSVCCVVCADNVWGKRQQQQQQQQQLLLLLLTGVQNVLPRRLTPYQKRLRSSNNFPEMKLG